VPDSDISRVAVHHFLPLGGADVEHRFEASVRKKIKQSDRAHVTVGAATSSGDWDTFATLYTATRRRLGLPAMPRSFFAGLQSHLPSCTELSLAKRDGRTLGALLALQFNGLYLVEWIGDTVEGRAIGVNQRLYWEAIQRARALRCHTFSFGRTDAVNHGLRDFKRRWGTIEEDIPCVFRLADGGSPALAPADPRGRGRLAAQVALGRAPVWAYGWLSEFCYRHLG
jgi:lipid II:glycine glycyltransferase (peptidoglycan interpeptide bridge formation enzyme)